MSNLFNRLSKAWNALVPEKNDEPPTPIIEYFSPESPHDLVLGLYVVDRKAAIYGYLVCKRETISGMVQYAIQRATIKGMPVLVPEFTDWNNIEYDLDDERLDVVEPANVNRIALGDWVKEVVSGTEGTVVERMTHLNGCVTLVVEYRTSDGESKLLSTHANRVEHVEGKDPIVLPVVAEPTPVGTGGFGAPMLPL
jgi:hypothetical protein